MDVIRRTRGALFAVVASLCLLCGNQVGARSPVNPEAIATYIYNAKGERISKTVGGVTTRFIYDKSSRLISESGPTGGRDYIYLGNILVSVVDIEATTSRINYAVTDHLGTPRAITDSTGNVIWQWTYQGNAFGEKLPISDGYTLNLRSVGEYYDAETGLNYNTNRTRDPHAGRFLQADPKGLDGGINPYVAVGNNPLRYTDRLGLEEEDGEAQVEETKEALQRINPVLGPNQVPQNSYQQELAEGTCRAPWNDKPFSPIAGNGGSLDYLTQEKILRIQNAANRIDRPINLVGSRASGTARPESDWDYVIDANAQTRNSVSRSLPGAGNLSEGVRPNLDVFKGQLNPDAPYVRFMPEAQ